MYLTVIISRSFLFFDNLPQVFQGVIEIVAKISAY